MSSPLSFRTDPDRALALFRERGYHIEHGLVPNDLIDRVMAMALALPNAADGTFRPVPMPHRVDPLFLEMMRFPPIVAIVETLVGGEASGLGGEFFYMRPGTPGFVKHQDNAYVQAPADKFVSVWTAMGNVDADNGCLVFYPGTHTLGALPTRELAYTTDPGQNPGAGAVECVLPEGNHPTMNVVAPRGSTVFFHSQLVHLSGPNRSQRFRYSFLSTYIRKGEPFRPGRAQKRTEIELHAHR